MTKKLRPPQAGQILYETFIPTGAQGVKSCTVSTRPGTEKPDSTKKATTGALRAPVGRGPKGRAYAFFIESSFSVP